MQVPFARTDAVIHKYVQHLIRKSAYAAGMDLPARLRAKREASTPKLSLKKVGDALGPSWQAVQAWEKGRAVPTVEHLKKLAVLYKTTTDELLTGKEPMASEGALIGLTQRAVKVAVAFDNIKDNKYKQQIELLLDIFAAKAVDDAKAADAHGKSARKPKVGKH